MTSDIERIAEVTQRRGFTIAVSESLTCGSLSAALGKGGNAAEWFAGGVVAYLSRVKFDLLNVEVGPVIVRIGTRFPAATTSLGKVLLSDLTDEEVAAVLTEPTRSGIVPRHTPSPAELSEQLAAIRERGWVLTDQELANGVRSVATPLRDGAGRTRAALNVTVHASETSTEKLLGDHLPRLLATAAAISADWARIDALPVSNAGGTG